MADVCETRCVSATFSRSEHLVRVACIGDSLMYGQGVLPRHTLPAHLRRLLNAAWLDRLVWVDNFGESSGNLWHAWSRFKAQLKQRKFDYLVFSVCPNDAQMFESNMVPYDVDKQLECWRPGSITYNMIEEVFYDVRFTCRRLKIAPLFIYYSFEDADSPIIEILQDLLRPAELPFINMLQYYRQQTGLSIEAYIASEFDGHPSSLGHELAARRVVAELIKSGERRLAGGFETAPDAKLKAALSDLIEQGVAIDHAIEWAQEVVTAKATAARRQRRSEGARLVERCAALERELQQCRADWRFARRAETTMLITPKPDLNARTVTVLDAHARNSDELAYLLDRTTNIGDLERLSHLFPANGDEELDRLSFFRGPVIDEIAAAKERLGALRVLRTPSLRAPSPLLGDNLAFRRDIELAIVGDWEFAAFYDAIDRLADDLDIFELNASRLAADTPDARRIWGIAFSGVRDCLNHLEGIDQLLAERLPDGPVGRSWTHVEVMLESSGEAGNGGSVCALQVEADYRVPRRSRIRESHWAGVEKERAVYRFEIPLLLLGDIRVGVGDDEPTRQRFLDGTTRITRIDIYQLPAGDSSGAADNSGGVSWSEPDSRLPAVEFRNILLP